MLTVNMFERLPNNFVDYLKYFYRRGFRFQEYRNVLNKVASYTPEQLAHYKNQKLQRVIRHCYQHVPYYQDLFRRLRLRPEDFQTPADLEKLPLLTKSIVVNEFDKLIARNRMNWLCRLAKTSGTTGSPGKFLRDFDAINFENACAWRQWEQAGDTGQRRITLRGEVVVPMTQTEPPFWRYNPVENELLMCGFHLKPENSTHYIDKILEFQPLILSSYPSNALRLARYFRQNKINYGFIAVFTSSEDLDPNAREFIEETFKTRVYDWYGQAERVAAISHCKAGQYHIQEDYS
jgi:phenylacetate-CoA ligase